MRKLRDRELKSRAQSHTAGKRQSQESSPSFRVYGPSGPPCFCCLSGTLPFPLQSSGRQIFIKKLLKSWKNRNKGEVRSAVNLVPTIFPKPRDSCTDSAPTSSSSPTDALWRDEFRSRVPYRSLLRCPKLSNVGPWPVSPQTQLETPAGKNEEQQLALDLRTRGLGGPRARG